MSAFLHGVASGDPTTRRVVIWTRVSGATGADPVPPGEGSSGLGILIGL